MKVIRCWCTIGLVLILAGCQGGLFFPPTPTSTVVPGIQPSLPPGATQSVGSGTAAPVPTQDGKQLIRLWVPPQFNPDSGTVSGSLLKARLDSFSADNRGISLEVRVKDVGGPGGLLESLSAASAAAPGALPDLVALPREELETAGLKGLLYPLDGLTTITDDADWYTYARQLGQLQGSTFGLPFAGDALAIVYRPALISNPPSDWDGLLRQTSPLAFAAGEGQALFTLAAYQASGGTIQDSQGRPYLSVEVLEQVLRFFQEGARKGVFPAWEADLLNDSEVWKAYQDKSAPMSVTWISHYLTERPPDSTAIVLPASGKTTLTFATGWLWGLSSPLPERRAQATRLAEYLVDSTFLSQWTSSAGYLPTRPTALAAWSDQSLQALLSQVVLSAQARPGYEIMGGLGPILRDATLQMLKDQADPKQAAIQAVTSLKGP
ncbi:MAG: extracellular solute-binding protein [Anaerolineaceae bacterium]|nr:extracellular solute-binding protein [Anaerolineaceae bacterium]